MRIEKVKKLVPNLYNKTEYVIHIKNSKQELNHGLVLKKVRVMKFNKNAWPKPYIDVNIGWRKKAENDFEKKIFLSSWMILKKIFLSSSICDDT